MSNGVLAEAPFIPLQPPGKAINDYSGILTGTQIQNLEGTAAHLGFKAKVVVLPQDFSPSSINDFTQQLARQWQVGGDRFLMVVDVKGHHVRTQAGNSLVQNGITHDYMSSDLIPKHFLPAMKQGDLAGAIDHTLTAVSSTVQQERTGQPQAVTTAPGRPGETKYPRSEPAVFDGSFLLVFLALVGAAFAALFIGNYSSAKKENAKLSSLFKERANQLYQRADQIGQASEYLPTDKHPELAQRVATFFNRLTALEKAHAEVERMEKTRPQNARDGYRKSIRLVQLLEPEAESLRTDLNALTGAVETIPSIDKPDAVIQLSREEEKVPVATRSEQQQLEESHYRRPSWSLAPQYYEPAGFNLGGLATMMLVLNQMEMSHRLNDLAYQQHHFNDPGYGSQQGGGDWGSSGNDSWGGGGSDGDSGGGDWGGGDFGGGDFGGGDW